MPRRARKHKALYQPAQAPAFAALGDKTRLSLIAKLCAGSPCSISELTQDFKLTRQAVTKHLRVLENAGIVKSTRAGRESRFEFDPKPMQSLQEYLGVIAQQWDQALQRSKTEN